MNTIALSISWGVGCYSFYFTEFYMKYVPVKNIFLLAIIMGGADIIASVAFAMLMSCFSAKQVISTGYLILSILSTAFAIGVALGLAQEGSTP